MTIKTNSDKDVRIAAVILIIAIIITTITRVPGVMLTALGDNDNHRK